MSMKKKDKPSTAPMSLHASLGHGKGKGKNTTNESPKGLTAHLKSMGGKSGGKGMTMNVKDDVKTEIHIPSAGAMKKKVAAQEKGQKKAKTGK
jgi:hypothetical protein